MTPTSEPRPARRRPVFLLTLLAVLLTALALFLWRRGCTQDRPAPMKTAQEAVVAYQDALRSGKLEDCSYLRGYTDPKDALKAQFEEAYADHETPEAMIDAAKDDFRRRMEDYDEALFQWTERELAKVKTVDDMVNFQIAYREKEQAAALKNGSYRVEATQVSELTDDGYAVAMQSITAFVEENARYGLAFTLEEIDDVRLVVCSVEGDDGSQHTEASYAVRVGDEWFFAGSADGQ